MNSGIFLVGDMIINLPSPKTFYHRKVFEILLGQVIGLSISHRLYLNFFFLENLFVDKRRPNNVLKALLS